MQSCDPMLIKPQAIVVVWGPVQKLSFFESSPLGNTFFPSCPFIKPFSTLPFLTLPTFLFLNPKKAQELNRQGPCFVPESECETQRQKGGRREQRERQNAEDERQRENLQC